MSLTDFCPTKTKQSEIDKKIILARCTGIPIYDIQENEVDASICKLMVQISCISGIGLPENESYWLVFVSELRSYLMEYGFESYTDDEIILAFQLNCGTVMRNAAGDFIEPIQLFGECISVDYVIKVLSNYRQLRNLLDRKLQNFIDGY